MKKCNNSNCKCKEYIIPGVILLAGIFIAYAILNSNKYNNIVSNHITMTPKL